MRVWVDQKEAKELRRWALENGRDELADRFFRAESWDWTVRTPFLWRWRSSHPVLVRCLACEGWEGFKRHRHAKKNGWRRYQGRGAWIHERCVADWERDGAEITRLRWQAKQRQERLETLFGHPELLESYDGVLLRHPLWQEHTFYGLLDDMEADITADFGMQRMRRVIDEMPDELRERLVAVAFLGFHFKYHLLLGWVGEIPEAYDEAELDSPDDVRCQSVLVDDLPRRIRDELPDRIRELV
jgi:hypothetical protein